MKAWQIASLGDPWDELNIVDLGTPPTEPETVRIRVEATDLNFADILQCQGSYQIKLTPPFTPGMNATGIVLEANPTLGFAILQPDLPQLDQMPVAHPLTGIFPRGLPPSRPRWSLP